MADWRPGDRVAHQTFGSGTVLACNEQHTVIHFDQHGRRKLATRVVVLSASPTPDPHGAPRRAAPATPGPRPVSAPASAPGAPATDVPSTIDQLIDLARRTVGSEDSLNGFVATMRKALPGPSHQHIGVLSGMRVQAFQNWLLDENPKWQLTDAQLLAIMRVEFPLATGQVHIGDVGSGLEQVAGIRAHYNRDGHNGPSPASRGRPPSKSYGTF